MASCASVQFLLLCAAVGVLRAQIYNTTETCLLGATASNALSLDCFRQPVQGHIFVRRVFHGLTPTVMGCTRSAPAASCCPPYNASRDCLYVTSEEVETLRRKCNGYTGCDTTLTRSTVGSACPPKEGNNLTYARYSYYGFVEYSCVNAGLMTDVCELGNINRGKVQYLDTNVFHKNQKVSNTTCSCTVSTTCGQTLLFTALTLSLPVNKTTRQCLERLVLEDSRNTSWQEVIGCNGSVGVDDVGETRIFESNSNVANVYLELLDANTGTLLVRITASGGADVEVRCGRSAMQDLAEDQKCLEDRTSTTISTTTTTSTAATTSSAESTSTMVINESTTTIDTTYIHTSDKVHAPQQSDGQEISTGAIVGVAVAVAIVCIILLFLLFLVWRSRLKRQPYSGEENSVVQINYFSHENPQFEDSKPVYDHLERESAPYVKTPAPADSLSVLEHLHAIRLNSPGAFEKSEILGDNNAYDN